MPMLTYFADESAMSSLAWPRRRINPAKICAGWSVHSTRSMMASRQWWRLEEGLGGM